MKKRSIFMIITTFILGAYGSRICQAMDDCQHGLGNIGMVLIVLILVTFALIAAFTIEVDDNDDYDF